MNVSFSRPPAKNWKTSATVSIDYPKVKPTEDNEKALKRKRLLCPGCSSQDVALGRCHTSILADHVAKKFGHDEIPSTCGMLDVFKSEDKVALFDDDNSIFVGRKLARGYATKSVGVKTTFTRSSFANPFQYSKNAFRLGESLDLYKKWIENSFEPLTEEEIRKTVTSAQVLPETFEELVKSVSEM